MKGYLHPSLESTGGKSEFGFGTVAAVSRSVTKRMSELLPPVLSNEGCIFN